MVGLFPQGQMQYNDNGDGYVQNSGNMFQNANITVTYGGSQSAPKIISNLYDNNASTIFYMRSGATTGSIVWDFRRKVKFINIIADYYFEAAVTHTYTLEGSQNNSAWTTIASGTTGAAGTISLVGNNVTYRYIKVTNGAASASGEDGMAGITGSTA